VGEIRFQDNASITCPECNTVHLLRVQHNHFHLKQQKE
jgi:hypothetical protein